MGVGGVRWANEAERFFDIVSLDDVGTVLVDCVINLVCELSSAYYTTTATVGEIHLSKIICNWIIKWIVLKSLSRFVVSDL